MTLNSEQLWTALWHTGGDFIASIMVLFFVLIIGIVVYSWFRFRL